MSVCSGSCFSCSDIEFICLSVLRDSYVAITKHPFANIPFDVSGSSKRDPINYWEKSTLRNVLKTDFLNLLDRRDLIFQKRASGSNTFSDYILLPTFEQFSFAHDKFPATDSPMWTITLANCGKKEIEIFIINPDGNIRLTGVESSCAVFPVCQIKKDAKITI